MNGFSVIDGVLHADAVPLPRIAAQFGTPAYVYSAGGIRETVRRFQAALANCLPENRQPLIAYACKANGNLALMRLMATLGLGCDIVSGGELARARAAGIDGEKIVFSGVGKDAESIEAALSCGVHHFNVESAPEMDRIAAIAVKTFTPAPIALRFNPDVGAQTHAKITTGMAHNKFGLSWGDVGLLYRKAAMTPGLRPVGLSMHIGSQITSLEPYRQAFDKLAALTKDLRENGFDVERLDLGGGLGIAYNDETPPDFHSYADLIRDTILPLGVHIVLEPGRALVADSGLLLTKIEYIKNTGTRRYMILDAAMNDFIRPALYDAWHPIVPVAARAGAPSPYDIVGPVCESGDTFAIDRTMPPLNESDLVAVLKAGAYGSAMASTYNARPLPPEILVDGDRVVLTRRRISVQDMMAYETVPADLA